MRYEQLRGDVLSLGMGQTAALGLALFLRKGMTAWMSASSQCIPTTGTGTLTSPTTVQGFSLDIRFEMTRILAGMILGQQQEAL